MRGPRIAAVALADEVLLRAEAAVLDQPVVDDAREILDVGRGAEEELFAFRFGDAGAAEAGADGVNEDQIGEVEPGAGIVGEHGGIGGTVALVADGQMLGADGAEVEIDAGRAGTAIEGEGDGTIVAFNGVGGDDDLAGSLAVGVAHRQGAYGGGVMQGFAIQLNRLRHMSVRGKRRQGVFVGSGLVCCGFVAAGLGIAGCGPIAGSMLARRLRRELVSRETKKTDRAHGQCHAPEDGLNPGKHHFDTIHLPGRLWQCPRRMI